MSSRIVQISLLNDKSIYEFLDLEEEEKVKAIDIGVKAIKLINETNYRYQNSEFNDKISENEIKFKTIIDELNKDLQQKDEENELYKKKMKIKEKKLYDEISSSTQLQYSTRLQEQSNIILNLKDENKQQRDEIQQIHDKFRNEERTRVNEERTRMETIVQKHQQDIASLHDKYDNRLNQISKIEENSSVKGKKSETEMLNELNMMFPKNEIEDVHNETARGDFIMTNDKNKKFMFENKNYANNVPKKEIEKFKRDMVTNNDINAGIFMSNASGICKKDDFQVEFIENKPVIYLHNTNKDINKIKIAYDFLNAILETNFDFSNKEITDKLAQESNELKRKISKCKKEIEKFKQTMMENIIDIEGIVKKTFFEINIKY